MKKLIVILFCVVSVQSCKDDQEAIRLAAIEELEIIKATYVAKKKEECIKERLDFAEMVADTIIATRSVDAIQDSTYQPKLRPKPTYITVDSSVFEKKRNIGPIN